MSAAPVPAPLCRNGAPCRRLVVAAAAVYAAPVFLSRYFPGLDLPWQAAIVEVLHRHDPAAVERDFLATVVVEPRLVSYMTVYALADLLAFALGSVAAALQVLVAASVLGFVLAAHRFFRAFGASGLAALLAAPAAYSHTLEFGFLAYALSYPLTLLLWSLVRELGDGERLGPRLVAVLGLAVLLALTHPFAAATGLIGVAVIAATCADRATRARLAAAALGSAAAALPALWTVVVVGGDAPAGAWAPSQGSDLWDRLTTHEYTTVAESLVAAPRRLLGFVPASLAAVLVAVAVLAAVWMRVGCGQTERAPGPRARSSLWLLVVLALVYLATPYTFLWPRIWYAAQPRVLPLLWVCLLSLLCARTGAGRGIRLAAAPLAVAAATWLALVTTSLGPLAGEAAAFASVIAHGQPRARTLALIEHEPARDREPPSPWRHAGAYLLLQRGGYVSNLPMTRPSLGNAGILVPVAPAPHASPPPAAPPPGAARTFDWSLHGRGWDQFLIRDQDPDRPHDYFGRNRGEVALVARRGRWRLYWRASQRGRGWPLRHPGQER